MGTGIHSSRAPRVCGARPVPLLRGNQSTRLRVAVPSAKEHSVPAYSTIHGGAINFKRLWENSWRGAVVSAVIAPLLAASPAFGGPLADCDFSDKCTTPTDGSMSCNNGLCPHLTNVVSLPRGETSFDIPTTFPALSDIQLLEYEKHVLPNGMTVFLVEDHEVPVIRGTLLLAGGAQADPPSQVGLSSVLAAVQRSGGTTTLPGEQLDWALEDIGATLESQSGLKTTSFSFSSLVEDTGRMMSILDGVVRKPQLPETQLKLKVKMGINSIEHRYDSSAAVPRRKMQQLLYGSDSPLSRQTSVDGLQSISIADLQAFRSRWQRPDTAVLGVVGDFDPQTMLQTVSTTFGDWQPESGQPHSPPPLPPLIDEENSAVSASAVAGRVYFVNRPGEVEAAVLVAEPGIDQMDPDAPSLDIASDILNGFGGRLFDKIRSEKALTYSVRGGWETPPGFPGLFTVSGSTERPAEFIMAVNTVLEGLKGSQPPTEEEVNIAKRSAANAFVFNYSSKQQQLGRLLVYNVLDLPEDYLVQYQAELMKVTPASVEGAVGRHLHLERQAKIIAGDAKRILPLPDKIGQAQELPLAP